MTVDLDCANAGDCILDVFCDTSSTKSSSRSSGSSTLTDDDRVATMQVTAQADIHFEAAASTGRVARRLAAVAAPSVTSPGPTDAERNCGTCHSWQCVS